MKIKLLTIILLVLFAATAAVLANSHPGEKSNGLGSSRFPNHYAGPSKPKHP